MRIINIYIVFGPRIIISFQFTERFLSVYFLSQDLLLILGVSDGKETARNAEDLGSTPGSRRSPGGGNGNPLQYSCLENPMDRGAWRAAVHGVTSQTQLKRLSSSRVHTSECSHPSLSGSRKQERPLLYPQPQGTTGGSSGLYGLSPEYHTATRHMSPAQATATLPFSFGPSDTTSQK